MLDTSLVDRLRQRLFSDMEKRGSEFETVLEKFWSDRSAKGTRISSTTIDFLRDLLTKELELRFSIVRESLLEMIKTLPVGQNEKLVGDLKSVALSHLEQ